MHVDQAHFKSSKHPAEKFANNAVNGHPHLHRAMKQAVSADERPSGKYRHRQIVSQSKPSACVATTTSVGSLPNVSAIAACASSA